jgi:hypothetical protein
VNPAIEDRFKKNAKTLGKPFADTSRNIAALLPAILPSLKSKNRRSQNQGNQRPNYLPLFPKSGNVAPTAH